MKKKITNEEVGNIIRTIANKICNDLDDELRIATSHLIWAENQLVITFDEKQKSLFNEYLEKQEKVLKIKSEMAKIKQ